MATAVEALPAEFISPSRSSPVGRVLKIALQNPLGAFGGLFTALVLIVAVAGPSLAPQRYDAVKVSDRLQGSSSEYILGTDSLGRDVWSRVAYGARVSLVVGVAVAVLSMLAGTLIGLVAGYCRRLDGPIMREMDGMMAIPSILFAIALVAAWRPSVLTVILAIVVPDTPRVARLVRAVVLSVREEPYVEAAVALDTPTWRLMLRHILPNAVAPLIVQGTFICAAAMLVESAMSFLGIGLPPDIPTWGNIMAEGRGHFSAHPHTVLLPGAMLALAVLAVNMLGDGLRDTLDPKFNQRGG